MLLTTKFKYYLVLVFKKWKDTKAEKYFKIPLPNNNHFYMYTYFYFILSQNL